VKHVQETVAQEGHAMLQLAGYNQLSAIHPETGTIRHALAYQGVRAPHTGEPLSEALLRGISGGLVAGYFTAEYHGYPPHLHFLTYNTFDPWNRLITNLGIQTTVYQTSNPAKAYQNLTKVLESGQVPILWADLCSLPYSVRSPESENCRTPLIVWAVDEESGFAHIADRAAVSLPVPLVALAVARGRIAREKNRVMQVALPSLDRLPEAVLNGIRTTIASFTAQPPVKPMRGKWGFDAFSRWATLLTDPKGWPKQYPPGPRLWAMLSSAFWSTQMAGTGGAGGRALFAAFLTEAALILQRPALTEVASHYRAIATEWERLGALLLPDRADLLGEARRLRLAQQALFLERGAKSLPERQEIQQRLQTLAQQAAQAFPLDEAGVRVLLTETADQLIAIRDREATAIQALVDAMA
jgi:hypothetical protein